MVTRRRKKIRKLRGSRTVGYGITGQNRGKGLKGGYGRSGRHKHLWTLTLKYYPNHFGKKGFKTPQSTRKRIKTINIGKIDQMIRDRSQEIELEKKGNKIIIDITKLGYNKVLGTGKITQPLVIKAPSFSKKAEEKIKKADGEAIKL